MFESYEHVFNEINYYISTSNSKDKLKEYQEELRKLYLEVLYRTQLRSDAEYVTRRYLLDYYNSINRKINNRLKER